MINPELAALIFFLSNLFAPLLAIRAGRAWPRVRIAFHLLAIAWVILSVYMYDKATFVAHPERPDDSYEPDEMEQFMFIIPIFFQQVIIVLAYVIRWVRFGWRTT